MTLEKNLSFFIFLGDNLSHTRFKLSPPKKTSSFCRCLPTKARLSLLF
jgi:hypothetical protein